MLRKFRECPAGVEPPTRDINGKKIHENTHDVFV